MAALRIEDLPGFAEEIIKEYQREQGRKFRQNNSEHYRTYQREYKRKMRQNKKQVDGTKTAVNP